MSTVKDVISLRFKSHQAEGVLLHGEGQRGDYITLELHRGRLDLYLNLDDNRPRFSSSRVAVTVGSLLDDQHWHAVHVERFNKQVNVSVDAHMQHFHARGDGHSLEVDYELSFGGIPLPGKPGTFLRKNFHGCMENLYYNGINIIDLAKRRKPQIHSVGNVTFSCSQPQLVACTFLSSSSSFLSLPSAASATGGFSARLQFRTWNPDGLLLSVQLEPEPQRLVLQISNSRLHLTLHVSGRQKSEVSAEECVTVQQEGREPAECLELQNMDLQQHEITSLLRGAAARDDLQEDDLQEDRPAGGPTCRRTTCRKTDLQEDDLQEDRPAGRPTCRRTTCRRTTCRKTTCRKTTCRKTDLQEDDLQEDDLQEDDLQEDDLQEDDLQEDRPAGRHDEVV
nr:contactin-associated protein-like 5 [Labrus bergylta]